MEEIWKVIEGTDGKYQISSLGRVKSLIGKVKNRELILKECYRLGYAEVSISFNNKARSKKIHRLVAQYFIPNPENKRCVNHKNGIKTDNRVVNLEWTTHAENNKHARDTGLWKTNTKEHKEKLIRILTKIPDSEFPKIFELSKANSTTQIAKLYKVSYACIRGILKGNRLSQRK